MVQVFFGNAGVNDDVVQLGRYPDSIRFMSFWNMTGAFLSPKGITVNTCDEPLGVVKAGYFRELLLMGTCQYPDFRSMVEKMRAFQMPAKVSWMTGRIEASRE